MCVICEKFNLKSLDKKEIFMKELIKEISENHEDLIRYLVEDVFISFLVENEINLEGAIANVAMTGIMLGMWIEGEKHNDE